MATRLRSDELDALDTLILKSIVKSPGTNVNHIVKDHNANFNTIKNRIERLKKGKYIDVVNSRYEGILYPTGKAKKAVK